MFSKSNLILFLVVLISILLVGTIYIGFPETNPETGLPIIYSASGNPYNPHFNYCSQLDNCMDPTLRMDCLGFKEVK